MVAGLLPVDSCPILGAQIMFLSEIVAMDSKLADEGRKALIAEARRLPREERLRAFARHSKLVIELYNAARRVRSNSGTRG
jgi:hypothetical protein